VTVNIGEGTSLIAQKLRQYATAVGDPTRGMILVELSRRGEMTGTQLAKRLDLTVNNVYHHLRVLRQLEVIGAPRVVPGDTYVEKYYSINPEISAALRLDPEWYSRARGTLSPEDQQAVIVGVCLTMALLLRQAARDYEEMDPATLDQYVRDQLLMLSTNRISREQLRSRAESVRSLLARAAPDDGGAATTHSDLLLFAALPSPPIEGEQAE
jgi:DNA-binding transcriptional ArsR family regulator